MRAERSNIKKPTRMRPALTMIELIFVMIVLGIISAIGAEIVAQVYENYIVQRALYRASAKTELALNQIANRLRYAIPGTVVVRNNPGAAFVDITQNINVNNQVLQWVGYDGDSFESINCNFAVGAINAQCLRPGWSGVCDIDAYVAGGNILPTPGSNLPLAAAIINNLGGNIANARIYFPDGNSYGVAALPPGAAGEQIQLDAAIPAGRTIFERYKLAWSSYALSCENADVQHPCGELWLYHHLPPVVGTPINNVNNNQRTLLLRNVTNFRFRGSEGSLRVKLCQQESIGAAANETVHTCKEKVIF